jgi:hypothetical protein
MTSLVKGRLNEKYKNIKSLYKTKSIIYKIKESDIDKTYNNIIKRIDDEYHSFKINSNMYNIFNTQELKNKQLNKQLNNIENSFYKLVKDMENMEIIVDEVHMEDEKLKAFQSYIDLMETRTLMTVDDDDLQKQLSKQKNCIIS